MVDGPNRRGRVHAKMKHKHAYRKDYELAAVLLISNNSLELLEVGYVLRRFSLAVVSTMVDFINAGNQVHPYHAQCKGDGK